MSVLLHFGDGRGRSKRVTKTRPAIQCCISHAGYMTDSAFHLAHVGRSKNKSFRGARNFPSTLIFAKDDSHAEDIVNIIRKEFGKGNDTLQRFTYKGGVDRIPIRRKLPELQSRLLELLDSH